MTASTSPTGPRRLVLIAHGSRREAANDEVRALTARLATALGDAWSDVRCAFLELATPSIPQALDAAASQGPGSIVVLPYFLVEGRHLVQDIGSEVQACRERHPQVQVLQAPYLGQAAGLVEMLAVMAEHGAAGSMDASGSSAPESVPGSGAPRVAKA